MKKIILTLFAAACASGVIYFSLRPSAAPIYWENGARQMYEFNFLNDVTYSMPSGEMPGGRQVISGVLNIRIFAAGKNSIKMGIQMSPVKVTAGGESIAALEKLLSTFFLAELSPDGRFIRYHFDPRISNEDGKIVAGIVQSFQFMVNPGSPSEWSGRETDGIGEYLSGYTAKKRYIVKKKLEYVEAQQCRFPRGPESRCTGPCGK